MTKCKSDPGSGKFVVTGSQQFGLLAKVSESLAGRAAFLTLLPFSTGEPKVAGRLANDPFEALVKGFYPPLFDREVTPYDWYTNYIASYVERDVRSIVNVKSPKLYFLDSGLVCRLLGIRTSEDLFVHPHRGDIFESFIVSEILKSRYNQGLDPDLYFWRDSAGNEVDVVFQEGQRLKALEIKSGKTFSPELALGLQKWVLYSGARPEDCALIYSGDRPLQWKGLAIVPWTDISI